MAVEEIWRRDGEVHSAAPEKGQREQGSRCKNLALLSLEKYEPASASKAKAG